MRQRHTIPGLLFGLTVNILFSISAAHADTLEIKTDPHGVQYVTGGIGSEEVEALQAYKKQFNLYFLFSEGKTGRVIDDVNLSIQDASKQPVFNVKHASPRLLLSLPEGKYLVIASYQGNKQRLFIQHDANKHQRVIINWRNLIEEDSDEPESPDDESPNKESLQQTNP